jgi:hypothetical protein
VFASEEPRTNKNAKRKVVGRGRVSLVAAQIREFDATISYHQSDQLSREP